MLLGAAVLLRLPRWKLWIFCDKKKKCSESEKVECCYLSKMMTAVDRSASSLARPSSLELSSNSLHVTPLYLQLHNTQPSEF